MRAETWVEVAVDDRGTSTVARVHGEAPLLVRTGRDDTGGLLLWLVNGAAGPLGGDELAFRLTVGDGASVTVRSVAAVLAQPGPHGDRSTQRSLIELGAGARLDWAPEPTISVRGSDHDVTVLVTAAADAEARIVETVSLGRHDEDGGRLSLHQRVERGGLALIDHRTDLAPGVLLGPGGHGAGRTVRSTLLLGPTAATEVATTVRHDHVAGTFPLAPGCSLQVERAAGGPATLPA